MQMPFYTLPIGRILSIEKSSFKMFEVQRAFQKNYNNELFFIHLFSMIHVSQYLLN